MCATGFSRVVQFCGGVLSVFDHLFVFTLTVTKISSVALVSVCAAASAAPAPPVAPDAKVTPLPRRYVVLSLYTRRLYPDPPLVYKLTLTGYNLSCFPEIDPER